MCLPCVNGVCVGSGCSCNPRWIGLQCQADTTIAARSASFMTYRILTSISHAIILGYVGWKLYNVIVSHQGKIGLKKKIPLQIVCLTFLVLGLFLRCLEFFVDPHAWRGIYNWQLQPILFNLPVILYILAYAVNLDVWMQMQLLFAKKKQEYSVKILSVQPRILQGLMVLFIILTLLSLLLRAARALSTTASKLMYNLTVAVMAIYVICCSVYFGGKIMKYLRQQHDNDTTNQRRLAYARGLNNMTRMVIWTSFFTSLTVFVLVMELIVKCGKLNPTTCTVVYHCHYRTFEAVLVLLIVFSVSEMRRTDGPTSLTLPQEKSGINSLRTDQDKSDLRRDYSVRAGKSPETAPRTISLSPRTATLSDLTAIPPDLPRTATPDLLRTTTPVIAEECKE